MLAVIDFHGLFQVIWVSIVASISATVLFSAVVYGAARADEARRTDRRGAHATALGALAVVAMLLFCAVVILGVTVMLNKD
jgi:hypothetical protein